VAFVALLWWLQAAAPRLGAAVAPPEARLRAALARQKTAHLADTYGHDAGGTLELRQVRFGDLSVEIQGDRARVTTLLEGEGPLDWRGGTIRVGYVGREAFGMAPCSINGWCADGDQLAGLQRLLFVLFRRLDAFNRRDLQAYGHLVSAGYQGAGGKAALLRRLAGDLGSGPPARLGVTAWQIRLERDRAIVGEDETLAVGDARPVELRARLELRREDGRWAIVDGL
jgi:hypothetical protein